MRGAESAKAWISLSPAASSIDSVLSRIRLRLERVQHAEGYRDDVLDRAADLRAYRRARETSRLWLCGAPHADGVAPVDARRREMIVSPATPLRRGSART